MRGFSCSLAEVLDQILCLLTGLVATGRARRDLQAFGANVLRRRPAADASPFISPRRPAGRAARRIAGLPGKPGSLLFACGPPRKSERGCECPCEIGRESCRGRVGWDV